MHNACERTRYARGHFIGPLEIRSAPFRDEPDQRYVCIIDQDIDRAIIRADSHIPDPPSFAVEETLHLLDLSSINLEPPQILTGQIAHERIALPFRKGVPVIEDET